MSRLYLLSVSEHGTTNIMSRLVQVLTVKKSYLFRRRDIVDTIYVTCEEVYKGKNLKSRGENYNTF